MEITPEELSLKLKKGERIKLIDVREPEEYNICHIEGALLIPMKEIPSRIDELKNEFKSFDLVVFHCHHGVRSMQVALWLTQNGFQNIKSLHGGIDAWAEKIDSSMARY